MSGGAFNYIQQRYEFDEAIERIESEIADASWSETTRAEFERGVEHIRKARIYLQRIDWLLSCDDGEGSFHKRLKEDLDGI